MAYGDPIRSAICTMSDVANLIEGTLVNAQFANSFTDTSFSSGTLADSDVSITVSVASGEKVLTIATAAVSHRTADQGVKIDISQDGTASGISKQARTKFTNSSGDDFMLTVMGLWAPSVGSHTYKVQHATLGSGTADSSDRQLLV